MPQGISCDSSIPGWAGGNKVVNKLSEISSDVCFYTCFVSILWEMSINKYESLVSGLQSMASSFVGLARYILESGIMGGQAGGGSSGALAMMIAAIEAYASGDLDIVGKTFDSFPNTLWAFLKGEVMRYFQPMMLASIQYMINDLKTELEDRRQLLGESELKIDEVKAAINSLFGYDWWEDWLAATLWASRHVREADLEIQRSHSDSNQGNWDSNHISKSQEYVLAALKLLSSDEDYREFITELHGGEEEGSYEFPGYTPFDSSSKINLYDEFMEKLKTVGKGMEDLKKMHTCLIRLSGRATILQALIVAATVVVNKMESETNTQAGIYIDTLIESSSMRQIHEKLVKMYAEMKDVIENERMVLAPVYNETWSNELKGILFLMASFGELPAPLGLDFHGTTVAASNTLKYLVYPHEPDDRVRSLSEYDFSEGPVGRRLQEFVLTSGNLADLLTRHSQWEQKITQIKTSIKNMKQNDARALALCETFEGYDSERFTYVVDMLDSAGWSGAHKFLTTGKLHEFMQLSVSSLSSTSTAVACLSKTIANMVGDSGLQIKLNKLLAEGMAEDRVATRSSVALPSFQFQAFNTIQGRLSALEVEMQDILDLQGEVCS